MSTAGQTSLRLDKWLWYARFFKSRALASSVCQSGKIRLGGQPVSKAHQSVNPGDVLTFPQGRHIRVVKVLADRWSYGQTPRFVALDFGPLARALEERTERRYWQVLLKRLMLRAAERVARRLHASALITGEAVGQVSSQTLQNLAVISEATRITLRLIALSRTIRACCITLAAVAS